MKKILFFILAVLYKGAYLYAQQDSTKIEWDRFTYQDVEKPKAENSLKVVSASRSAKSVADLPVTVHVISKNEILRNGYTTLIDVLKSVPGFRVSKVGGGIEGEMFLMRGLLGNYYTKILINNIPVQPSTVSGMPIGEQLPIRQAERIEVIYGPASAVYGADAIAGVINIITQVPDETVYAQADVFLGQYGYNHINFLSGGKFGIGDRVVHYGIYGEKGYRQDLNIKDSRYADTYNPLHYSPDSSFLSKPNYVGTATAPKIGLLRQESHLIGLQLKYKGLQVSYDIMMRKDPTSIGGQTNFYVFADPEIYWAENIRRLSIANTFSTTRWNFTTNLSYLQYRLDNLSSFKLADYAGMDGHGRVFKFAASDDIFAEQLITFRPNESLEFISGFSFQYSGALPKTNDLSEPFDPKLYKPFSKKVEYNDPLFGSFGVYPTVFQNIAAFLQAYYNKNNFTLIVGGRYDRHSVAGGSFNPRAALLYKYSERGSIRASVGTAFRSPSPYYTYNSVAFPSNEAGDSIFYLVVPNKNLKPEIFRSYEVGIRQPINRSIYLETSVYYNRISGFILNSKIPRDVNAYPKSDQEEVSAYINDPNARAELFALQLRLLVNDIIPKIVLNADIGLTLAKGMEKLPLGAGSINNFKQMPPYLGQLNLSFSPYKRLYVNIQNVVSGSWYGRYIDTVEAYHNPKFKTKGYYVMDMTARYELSKYFYSFIKITNAFNAAYAGIDMSGSSEVDMLYNPQMGRNIQIGFSFHTR